MQMTQEIIAALGEFLELLSAMWITTFMAIFSEGTNYVQ